MDTTGLSPELSRVVVFFEHLSRADVARLGEIYSVDASFKDPFNEVRGLAAVSGIFAHMFEQVHEPRFVVTSAFEQGAQAFLAWEFRFRMKSFDTRTLQTVRGATHLRFAADGRVALHRDYWDAAEELYEKLPLLGGLMRWLKRRANA
ncbi:MAG: nuclear transport factor 2 family protein [Burkholderiales bacterium]|nr:nuclear transport factor 2 family protein [Burkholderiales bacterium]